MDNIHRVYEFLKERGYTLNFQEVRAEVNRIRRNGEESLLMAKVDSGNEDDVYDMLFVGSV